MARTLIALCWMVTAVAFVGAMLWPGAALLVQCVSERRTIDPHMALGMRHVVLLARTAALVSVSTLVAIAIGLAAAPALVGRYRRFALLVCLIVLFCPPMVYAFGWQKILPAAVDSRLGCMAVWSLWSWPIAAMIIAGGLRGARTSFEAALLSTGRVGAYLRVVIPSLVPQIVLAALVIAVLLLAEYTTPHAFGLVVYATELLGWATSSPNVIDAAVASIPLVGIIALLLVASYVRVRGHRRSDRDERAVAGQAGGSLTLLISLGVLAAGLPIGALLLRLSGPEALAVAMHTYGQDVAYSLAVATAAAAASIGLAIAVAYTPRLQRLMVAGTVLCGVVPGALVGEALIAAFNRPALSWVYDHWPIVALAYCARFAWIGALTGWLLGCDLRSRLGHQAATDGATRADALLYVTLPRHAALLGGVGVTVIALALAEVASTSMVRVPAFAPISQVIIEKFHRFEDDMLISLSLLLIISAIAGAVVLACAGDRHRSAS